jgi:hypothetical protein
MTTSEETPGAPKILIAILLIVLFVLLSVPVISIALAIKKSGWKPVANEIIKKPSSILPNIQVPEPEPTNNATTNASASRGADLSGLKAKIEMVASRSVHQPILHPKIKQVQIQTTTKAPLLTTTNEVHKLLNDQHRQYVEASEQDTVRIILILDSKDWPQLSGSLQEAANKDGFLYKGPSTTVTANQADTMVAEIEIVKKKK